MAGKPGLLYGPGSAGWKPATGKPGGGSPGQAAAAAAGKAAAAGAAAAGRPGTAAGKAGAAGAAGPRPGTGQRPGAGPGAGQRPAAAAAAGQVRKPGAPALGPAPGARLVQSKLQVRPGGFYPSRPHADSRTAQYCDEMDEDDQDFVVDDEEEEEDWRKEMRQLTGYDPRRCGNGRGVGGARHAKVEVWGRMTNDCTW